MRLLLEGPSFDVDVKRFYVPGAKLVGACPECGAPFEHDFGVQYLSYPKTNEPLDVRCYCDGCAHEWTVPVILVVSLALAAGAA